MSLSSSVRWSRARVSWLVVALSLLAGVAWWRYQPAQADAIVLRSQGLQRTLQFTARVKTPARVEVGSTITGRVAQVLVREGDEVKAGAPLVQLEADEWRATWQQAQASWQQAQAKRNSQQGLALPNAQSALAQAEANVLAAERDVQRVRELVASQFYSVSKLDESQRTLDVARAQRDAARAQVQANREQGGEGASAQAQVASALAAVNVARAKLDQTTVSAPAAARVLVRNVEPGQIVQAGKGLLTLSVAGPLELSAQVDERFLGQLQTGQVAKVLADAYPSQPFDAKVVRLAPSVNAQSGSLEVVFSVSEPKPAYLREDMTLSVEVLTSERTAALVLPLRALRSVGAAGSANADRATVLVIDQGHARERAVTLGLRTLDQAEVRSGLREGEVVLLDASLNAGARVKARAMPDHKATP